MKLLNVPGTSLQESERDMPIIRANGLLVYFAHVPKCGGSTVEHNLVRLGYQPSFLDQDFYNEGRENWSNSSPQHIPTAYLKRYFKPDFFDYSFSVLRDPVERFVSAFNFKRGSIGWLVGFERFLRSLEKTVARTGAFPNNLHDNHFLPAVNLVPEDAEVFYLSDGLLNIFRALEARIGLDPIERIETRNAGRYSDFRAKSSWHKTAKDLFVRQSPRICDLSNEQVARVKALYAADYARFFNTPRAESTAGPNA